MHLLLPSCLSIKKHKGLRGRILKHPSFKDVYVYVRALLSRSVVSNSVTPKTVAHQASLSMGILQARILEWFACPPPGDLPNPEMGPWSPALRADSLPPEPPAKPKNTGVGSLSLLQGIFPAQESNQGLWHGRQILYQLSYQGSPCV